MEQRVESRDVTRWQQLVSDHFGPNVVHVPTAADDAFHASMCWRPLADLVCTEMHTSGAIDVQRREPAAGHPHMLYLFLVLAGTVRHSQAGRTARSQRGTMTLIDAEKPYSALQSDGFHSLIVAIPKALFRHALPRYEALCVQPCSTAAGAGAMIWQLLTGAWQQRASLDRAEQRLLQRQLLEWLERLVAARPEPRRFSAGVQRQRLLDYVETHLDEAGLTVPVLAAALGVSARYLHRLMRDESESLARMIGRLRLERARRDLLDARQLQRSIAEIALRRGFGSPNLFSRLFRRRFGVSPREWRRACPAPATPRG